MSWSGFKKATSRAATNVLVKTGHVEKTTDREYEVEERRYRTLESASLRLQKEAKGYLDSLRAMTASQMRIAETIDAFYGDSGAKDGVSRSYKQAVEDLDAETVKALDGPYRCVPLELKKLLWDQERGMYDEKTLADIEAEMDMVGVKRTWTRSEQDFESAAVLIENIYRTTVLEPINRFCAYFPDINECIKKRNHKMLDYDSMRSKVKKLVDKPDKDPSKLPRTEKETEMVSMTQFLDESAHAEDCTLDSFGEDLFLAIPSPPKALDHVQRVQQLQTEEHDLVRHLSCANSLGRSPSIMSRMTSHMSGLRSPKLGAPAFVEGESLLQHSPSLSSFRPPSLHFPRTREGSTEALLHRSASSPPINNPSTASFTVNHPSVGASLSSSIAGNVLNRATQSSRPSLEMRTRSRTPFFHPSELELLMQPLRDEYIRTQTNSCIQAKAAYDQLNEQLTTELPQLIDLRVPYLDPSFEALVKIQLRFCAEAYSRMAQVQQYLDASTRDQYASGDLDARVEDVLAQIRELSIAGTV